jgi:THO complex subunit 2
LTDYKRPKLDEKDATVSGWLANMALFSGLFFKKHYWIDIQGIMTYLCNKMQHNEIIEMVIMKEILAKMSGWASLDLEEMSETQLQCLAGGFLLRMESAALTNDFRSTKKSENALKILFWKKTNQENIDFK